MCEPEKQKGGGEREENQEMSTLICRHIFNTNQPACLSLLSSQNNLISSAPHNVPTTQEKIPETQAEKDEFKWGRLLSRATEIMLFPP